MRTGLVTASYLISALLTGCSGEPAPMPAGPVAIAPQDFVVLPCGRQDAERPCALAVAGGKRVIFGAPAGAARGLSSEDLQLLDAVLVFSLRARDIEGLDELRNESWRAGRSTPLLVIGPTGIEDVVDALNKTFEQADALRIVEEGIPPGGYDAAVMTARAGRRDQTVFDTGDVQVRATRQGYDLTYNQTAVLELSTCASGVGDTPVPDAPEIRVRLGCDPAMSDTVWPLEAPLFIVKN